MSMSARLAIGGLLWVGACNERSAVTLPVVVDTPAAKGTAAVAAGLDLALAIVIRRAVASPDSVTHESYTNLNVQRSDGRWAFVGCVASGPGACFFTSRTFLTEAQIAGLTTRVDALDHADEAAPRSCFRLATGAPRYQPGDYLLDRRTVSYAGSLAHQAPACPPSNLATWLADNSGL